jgi:hypothetical protein
MPSHYAQLQLVTVHDPDPPFPPPKKGEVSPLRQMIETRFFAENKLEASQFVAQPPKNEMCSPGKSAPGGGDLEPLD